MIPIPAAPGEHGPIPTRQRRPARWADSHAAPRPEGGPPFPRAGARRPLRTPVGDVRQLRGGERD
ncbi:hypothetical protein YI52_004953 [Salmonella enterica subsp. enterica serovar Livingstone]|nr:hypothetical protein [Salmonella enterica subsp. enterica serovar Senftenberg]EBR8889563.1 hypothetical protein [Salmonella enterica subsp. enterica serovar Galiema]ECR7821675.1 hypothetical protein [Salmonella enterica]EDQ7172164.1 hypothetical protein [Salmonella enterica subsp. enterica]EED7483701.1 hypothetical protein [Salmonella enterica subsp. enterica serovar Livingstone]EFC1972561.1 hypothetical protein [Escherichia coli]HAE5459561.1 hypothetical protein [Salmonella enterica subsp